MPAPGRLEQIATRVAFFIVGFSVAAWAPLIPIIRARLGLDSGQLGTLLLCFGLGSVLAMPVSGWLASRFGCRLVIVVCSVVTAISLPVMAMAPGQSSLAVAILCCGAAIGSTDVVMNIQAVIVEKASGRSMMSGFHGMYSVGGIAGAAVVTILVSSGLSAAGAAISVSVTCLVLLVASVRGLLPYGGDTDSPIVVIPRGRVLLIGILCFVMFMAEGSVMEWSGVLLNTVRGLEKDKSGVAYVAFSLAMSLGRLTGDTVVGKLGSLRVLLLGGTCTAAGFSIAALAPSWPMSVCGFAIVGIGAANVVPVLFTAAGKQKAMPSNLAVSAISTMGYLGILAGPGMIGFVAKWTTLPIAILGVAAMVGMVVVAAKSVVSSKEP